jgi:hypothetical protein
VPLTRLQHLEACEARADLQERQLQLLQRQIDETDAAFKLELARGEKHAEALMQIQRTCDSVMRSCDRRVDELKAQHAAAIIAKENAVATTRASFLAEIAALKSANAAAIAKLGDAAAAKDAQLEEMKAQRAALEAQLAVLQAQATSQLTDMRPCTRCCRHYPRY